LEEFKTIFVDSREPGFLFEELRHQKVKFKVEKLPVADFTGKKRNVYLERKRPEDIWNRITNRKWHKQMQAMYDYCIEHNAAPYLLIEGSFEDSMRRTNGKVKIPEVRGAIISASVRYFCSVWYCRDLPDLVYNATRICKNADQMKLGTPKKLPFNKFVKDRRIGVIMNVCQVSARQAESLLKRFKTISSILLAKQTRLQSAPYIGPSTAKRICRVNDSRYRV